MGTQLSGNYELPLSERDGKSLMVNSGQAADSVDGFCLKSGCHDESHADLTAATANLSFNPHDWHHEGTQCSDCHKSHRASVMYCTECHEEASAVMPSGWVTCQVGEQIREAT
ncbi:MAG: cytochrome c3 family protein [Coriobacteriales bacterium]